MRYISVIFITLYLAALATACTTGQTDRLVTGGKIVVVPQGKTFCEQNSGDPACSK